MKKIIIPSLAIAFALLIAIPVLHAEEPTTGENNTATGETTDETAPEAAAVFFNHDHTSYTVTLTEASEPTTGMTLTVVPKTGFKVNVAYPWKFTMAEATLKKDAFTLTEQESTLALSEATQELTGVLRFSICNDTACLVEKVEVAAAAAADAPKE